MGEAPQANFKDDPTKVLSAPDFTYDKTGLPRYVEANRAVFSALAYDAPGRTDTYGSSSGIVTGSSFDDVGAWYRRNLPAGWSDSAKVDSDQLSAIAQQLSPDKIMGMLAGAGGATPSPPVGAIPATPAADRTRVLLLQPPVGTKGEPDVMIVQRGDRPVTILMKAHISP